MGPVRGGFKKRKRTDKKSTFAAAELAGEAESRDWWDCLSARISGPLSKEPFTFESVFKMSRRTFNYICSLVREDMTIKPSFVFSDGKVLTIDDQVAIAIRRLCSGESQLMTGSVFGVSRSTVAQITLQFVEAMEVRAIHHIRWPTSQEMNVIKSKFRKISGFPNCCGVIDITRIMMSLPVSDSSSKVWVDYEKNHSMVLQVIVDPDMRFLDIITGWPGSMNESLLLQTSGFFKMCKKGTRLNGDKVDHSKGYAVREYILGDSGFPLLPWLLTPYHGKDLMTSEVKFNKSHAATQMVAQSALSRLKDTWKIIQGEMWRPDKHKLPRIILICCLLHNIIIDMEDNVRDEFPLSKKHDDKYRQQFCEVTDEDGIKLRDVLAKYFGRLPP